MNQERAGRPRSQALRIEAISYGFDGGMHAQVAAEVVCRFVGFDGGDYGAFDEFGLSLVAQESTEESTGSGP